jgi:hypothetical protein
MKAEASKTPRANEDSANSRNTAEQQRRRQPTGTRPSTEHQRGQIDFAVPCVLICFGENSDDVSVNNIELQCCHDG